MIKFDNNGLEIDGSYGDVLVEYGVIVFKLLECGIDECMLRSAFENALKEYKKER